MSACLEQLHPANRRIHWGPITFFEHIKCECYVGCNANRMLIVNSQSSTLKHQSISPGKIQCYWLSESKYRLNVRLFSQTRVWYQSEIVQGFILMTEFLIVDAVMRNRFLLAGSEGGRHCTEFDECDSSLFESNGAFRR